MGEGPGTRHGVIAMLAAIRVAGERKRRELEAEAARPEPPKKKRRWFG